MSTIGKAVASVLAHPAETANKYIHVNSYRATQNQILASLEKATGSKWTTEKASSAEANKRGSELLAKYDMSGLAPSIVGMEWSGADWLDFSKWGLWNEKLGLPPTNQGMDEAIAEIVKSAK